MTDWHPTIRRDDAIRFWTVGAIAMLTCMMAMVFVRTGGKMSRKAISELQYGGVVAQQCPPTEAHVAGRADGSLVDETIDAQDRIVPHAVFTDPQVGRSDYAEQGEPNALGETDGFVKIVSDADTGTILGGHIVGEQGANLIHEIVLAMKLGGTAQDTADTIHIHPTLPEVVNSAAGGVHKPS